MGGWVDKRQIFIFKDYLLLVGFAVASVTKEIISDLHQAKSQPSNPSFQMKWEDI